MWLQSVPPTRTCLPLGGGRAAVRGGGLWSTRDRDPSPKRARASDREPASLPAYVCKALMFTLFHHPFCPHSRFVRLALGEYALEPRLAEERVWERREAFLALNPAGTTPVLISEGRPAIP